MPSDVQSVSGDSLLDRSAFDRHYGLELLRCTADGVAGQVRVAPELTQPTGVVHGGVYASISEALASAGTNCGVVEHGNVGLGMHNSTSFLRPVSAGVLHATARPRHRGATTWVWDVDMTDDAGRLCATSRVTIAVRRRPAH